MAQAKDYGVLPWWAPDDLRLGLWRPLTAFTHWLDYRLFPDSPALMHAENIACFAAIVFLGDDNLSQVDGSRMGGGIGGVVIPAGWQHLFPGDVCRQPRLHAVAFLRADVLYEHHQWRSTKSRSALALSALFLALSLFANEGGASTFAFILAYALVLEPGSFRNRALTVLPAILVIVLWRTIYQLSTSGVAGVGGYIDPANEPFLFAREVVPRTSCCLAAQISGIAPELLLAVKPSLQAAATALFCCSLSRFGCFPSVAAPGQNRCVLVRGHGVGGNPGGHGVAIVQKSRLRRRWRLRIDRQFRCRPDHPAKSTFVPHGDSAR